MFAYKDIEKYLPEMTALRREYENYLQTNHISKNNEEKLYDYFLLIEGAYKFDAEKYSYDFSQPDIAQTISSQSGNTLYSVNNILAHKLRYRKMSDSFKDLPAAVKDEMTQVPAVENCSREFSSYWFYKNFPLAQKIGTNSEEEKNVVRYGLNVKPGVGLFKKLDDLCLKHNVFFYKVADEKFYNQRTDPIIIYATKASQNQMIEELSAIVGPYIRKDDYDMLGYTKLNNGVFMAQEAKGEQVKNLLYEILDKDEVEVYTHPLADEFEQFDREDRLREKIYSQKDHPLKKRLFITLSRNLYDNAFSSAQFQAYKMMVKAYNSQKNSQHKNLVGNHYLRE